MGMQLDISILDHPQEEHPGKGKWLKGKDLSHHSSPEVPRAWDPNKGGRSSGQDGVAFSASHSVPRM